MIASYRPRPRPAALHPSNLSRGSRAINRALIRLLLPDRLAPARRGRDRHSLRQRAPPHMESALLAGPLQRAERPEAVRVHPKRQARALFDFPQCHLKARAQFQCLFGRLRFDLRFGTIFHIPTRSRNTPIPCRCCSMVEASVRSTT